MVWYVVSIDNVLKIFFSTLKLISISRVEHGNISLPTTEESLKKIAKDWSDINLISLTYCNRQSRDKELIRS
jgi:hypothetical protein